MAATIYGNHCSEKAQLKREKRMETKDMKDDFWNEKDFDDMGLGKYGAGNVGPQSSRSTQVHVFRAWFEDWEKDSVDKEDPTNKAKFLEKYGNLRWLDIDNPTDGVYTADKEMIHFSKLRGKQNKGYQIIGRKPHYDSKKNPDAFEHWSLKTERNEPACLYACIIEYYKIHPDTLVRVIEKKSPVDGGKDAGSGATADNS